MDTGNGANRGRKSPTVPTTSTLTPTSPKASRAFLYTPFGGSDALDSALGENMVRVSKGKQAHALLAPSHAEANRLETIRQVRLTDWKSKLDAADQALRRHHNEVVAKNYTHKMRIRQIAHDKSLTPEQREAAIARQKEAHILSLPVEYTIAQSEKALYASRFRALEQTRIANATINVEVRDTPADPRWPNLAPAKREIIKTPKLFPSLHPDKSPLSNMGTKDKLYVLGHGAPVSDELPHPGLYATPSMQGQSLSPTALAKHLSDAGLPKDFHDLRLTACQSIPALDEIGPNSVEATRNSGFLAPELSKAVKNQFPNLSITGYMGNGVTFPFNASHHLRSAPNNDEARAPRKAVALKFPPIK